MGEIAINPTHNVHQKYRQMNLVNPYIFAPTVDLSTNTYIGGVASTIGTASALATRLAIDVSRITAFEIVGSDIKCKITGSYVIPTSCFYNDSNITYYTDSDGLITDLQNYAFNRTSKIKYLEFKGVINSNGSWLLENSSVIEFSLPNATSILNIPFNLASNLVAVYIPRCTNLGGSSANNNTLYGVPASAIIYAHPSLATNNSGTPDGDLTGINVHYVTNFTAPNPVTTLAVATSYNTAIQFNFTAPTGSTNAIDFYEVYVNGIYHNKFTGSIGYAIGLTASTSYSLTVKVVDVFYNKSTSNIITASTSNYSYTDTDANASIAAKSLTGSEKESEYRLIVDLKANSLYTKTHAIYTFKGMTSATHKFNSKNPVDTDAGFRLTFNGTASYSNLGYTPNGSTGYANSYFIPSANQAVNSNGMTLVVGTNNAAAGNDVVDVGSFNSGTQKSYVIVKNNNTTYARIAGLNSNNISLTGTNESRGVFTGTKQSATVTDFFINGTQVGTVSGGGTLPTYNVYIGCMNYINNTYGFSNQRFQMVIFHEGLSDAEVATLHSIINLSEIIAGRKTW